MITFRLYPQVKASRVNDFVIMRSTHGNVSSAFDIQRTFFTEERPVKTARIVIPGDRYSLVYTFRVTEDDDPVTE